jgi:hypothetical protein
VPILIARQIAFTLCKQPPIMVNVCVMNETLRGDLRAARLIPRIMDRVQQRV